MKKIIIFISLLSLGLGSCFDDNSNKEVATINPIVVDMNGAPTDITLFSTDKLLIQPLCYKEGTNDANLSFEWKVMGNTAIPKVLATTMTLNQELNLPPYSKPYDLIYTVTDNNTGLQKKVRFRVTLNSNFSNGLIVADTRDEKSSDLTLIMSENFNSAIAFDKPKIMNELYSKSNGHSIEGLVRDIRTTVFGTNRMMTVITDNSIIRADQYDYLEIGAERDGGVFSIPLKKSEIKPQMLSYDGSYGQDVLINDGKLHICYLQNNGRKFSYLYLTDESRYDYQITHICHTPKNPLWMWDETRKTFLYIMWDALTELRDQSNSKNIFRLDKLQDWRPLYLGVGDKELHFIMKERTNGQVKDYVINYAQHQGDNGSNLPKELIDFSSSTTIQDATLFAMNPMERRIYYVHDNKLYSRSLNNQYEQIQFTPKEGETITSIKVWEANKGFVRYKKVGAKENEDPFIRVGARYRAMIITTYNQASGTGKVTVVPIATLNAALEQDRDYHVEYTGFGRILCVSEQQS